MDNRVNYAGSPDDERSREVSNDRLLSDQYAAAARQAELDTAELPTGLPVAEAPAADYSQEYLETTESLADLDQVVETGRQARPEAKPSVARQAASVLLGEIRAMLACLFSRRPMTSFNCRLSWLSLLVLAILNILLTSLAQASLLSKSIGRFDFLSRALAVSEGKVFWIGLGYGILAGIVLLLLNFALLSLLVFALKGKRSSLHRFCHSLILAALPQTVLALLSLVLSLASFHLALGLLFTGFGLSAIFLYAGFQKHHSGSLMSPYWPFSTVLFLNIFGQYELLRICLAAIGV